MNDHTAALAARPQLIEFRNGDIALHSTGAMVRAIAAAFSHTELMDTWTWLQSGLNTDGAHNPVTTRRLRSGDILSLNCFARPWPGDANGRRRRVPCLRRRTRRRKRAD